LQKPKGREKRREFREKKIIQFHNSEAHVEWLGSSRHLAKTGHNKKGASLPVETGGGDCLRKSKGGAGGGAGGSTGQRDDECKSGRRSGQRDRFGPETETTVNQFL